MERKLVFDGCRLELFFDVDVILLLVALDISLEMLEPVRGNNIIR